MPEANLLVTFEPMHEESAKAEIQALLKEVNETAKIIKFEDGLAELIVKDARGAVRNLLKICIENNSKFKYSFNWWPVDEWCKADIKEIQKVISELEKSIKKEEKWKLDLSKRRTQRDYGRDAIIKLTEVINKPKVDLGNPDKIIKVDIIENKAAVAVISKDEFLNVLRVKG